MPAPGVRTSASAGGGDNGNGQEFEDDLPGSDGGQEDGDESTGQTDGQDAASGELDGEQDPGRQQDLDDDLADFFPAQRTPSRGQDRIQRLANENAELKRQLQTRVDRPVQPVQPTGPVGQPQIESDAEFQARCALLNPEDRMEAKLDRNLKLAEHRENVREFQRAQREQQQEMARDQRDFDSKAQSDGRYKRWADRVEAKHQEFARQGQFVPREAVFRYLLGEHLLSREGQAEVKRQAARGKARVERQTTPPRNGGSDVGGRGRAPANEREARARRLENVQI